MSVRVDCPGCGGPVVFTAGTAMVSVCPHCRSVVARSDRSVETLGKVADLVETGTLLKVGLYGKYDGVGFRLTGRAQLGHEAGGVWDEWYAAFDDNRWGWLSESQGRFHMLFEEDALERWPVFESLAPGSAVELADAGQLVVAEVGRATAKGAEGEIPYRLVPGESYLYADLSGPDGGFGTLAYGSSPPGFYLGREVTPDDLGLPPNLKREIYELRKIAAMKVSCPNCGGPLDLRAPDRTERVGCPYCGSLLDAAHGDLKVLSAVAGASFSPVIPLGSVGRFRDGERTVIGAFLRSVTAEGVEYPWQEYLLYDPRAGFEWLIRANNHWTLVKGIPAANVLERKSSAVYDGRTFQAFNKGTAVVRGVVGECYWKVTLGEEAETIDYIKPPELLSVERQSFGESREVNWSVGTYMTPKEVQTAFGLPEPLPDPEGVAPNQPFPFGRVYRLFAQFMLGLFALGLLMLCVLPSRKIHEQTFQLRPVAPPVAPTTVALAGVAGTGVMPPSPVSEKTQIFFTDLFELTGNRNLRVTVNCPQLTGWLAVEGDLVRQEDGVVQPFVLPLTHYSGVEEGEAWSEGDKEDYLYLSSQPRGKYSLRLEVERENAAVTGPLTVRVEQGVPHAKNWILALLGLLLLPIGLMIYHMIFASRRWSAADFSMFQADKPGGTPAPAAAAAALPAGDAMSLDEMRAAARARRERKKKKKGRDK